MSTPDGASRPGSPEIRRRALGGVALVGARELAVRGFALVGNIVLARMLTPSDFGLVAFGLALLLFVQVFSDGGLGIGLIRRPQAPSRSDLEALLGLQLALTALLGLAVAGVAITFGHEGTITAVMMPALPILALQTPTVVVFERELRYAPLVRIEVAQELAYYAWAVATIALGAGVWGLATASIVKALVGTIIMFVISPVATIRPRGSWRRLRPLLGFGVRYQAVQVVNTVRDQGLNLLAAVVGGLPILGLWTLTRRIMLAPFLLFGALWRVSYPASAKLLSAGERARPLIEQGVSLTAVGAGAILAPLAGAASPLVAVAFGPEWNPVARALPPICFALQVSGPVSVATAGYLYAIGETRTVLRSAVALATVWIALGLALLPWLGVLGLALGWMAASLVESFILARAAIVRTQARVMGALLPPLFAMTVAATIGWLIATIGGHTLGTLLAALLLSFSLYAGGMLIMCRHRVYTIVRLVSRAGRAAAEGAPGP